MQLYFCTVKLSSKNIFSLISKILCLKMLSTKKSVFLPPFIFVLAALTLNLISPEKFLEIAENANTFIINTFDNLFIVVAALSPLICFAVFIFPFSKAKIGGENAEPIFKKTKYFAIVLCTTVATGILFWGSAEPIYHLQNPPLGLKANSNDAALFALEAVYLHWTFVPYALYSVISLAFAFGYYNLGKGFSLSSSISPILPKNNRTIGIVIDNIALIGLILGMSASLGAGILSLSGGLEVIFGLISKLEIKLLIAIVIISAFVISAVSGLQKGIKWLSNINLYVFIFLSLFVLLLFDPFSILSISFESLKSFFQNFPRDLILINNESPDWAKSWSIFNWANWLAWAPITGVFLGKIAKGLSIREFMLYNWILPSIFGIIWMSIFSGTSLLLHTSDEVDMISSLNQGGPEILTYMILKQLPLFKLISIVFLMSIFISYVTAADSNIDAISSLSTRSNPKKLDINIVKIIWGVLIGSISLIMISSSGIEGIKMLSNLGGLPSAFLMIFVIASIIALYFKKHK